MSAFTAALFFIWILPLGIYIQPTQEKTACNGQRAICLCSHTSAKVKASPVDGFGVTSGSHKESTPAGGAGHYFVAILPHVQNSLAASALSDPMLLAYRNPLLKSIEHIPKV